MRYANSKIKPCTVKSLEEFFYKSEKFSEKTYGLRGLPQNGSGVLYRGQSNATWLLETTLERGAENHISFSEYFAFLQKMNLPALDFLKQIPPVAFKNDFEVIDKDILAAFAYVRHIGGPSPLLDWTRDRDVALFFAFSNIPKMVEDVSIFIFLDGFFQGHGIGSIPRVPLIRIVSREEVNHLLTHSNHVLQKSEYSYCFFGGGNANVVFAPHEERLSMEKEMPALGCSLCVKFVLPVSLRKKVFEYLKGKGINEYTLFKSDGAYVRREWVNSLERKNAGE